MSSTSATDYLADLFGEPLDHLGAADPALHGIYAPRSELGAPRFGVTEQFLEHAADYDERYANREHFRVLLHDALATLDPTLAPRRILDIGSGSGNSVFPLLDRFADAFVVASDISPQLLAILRDHLDAEPAYRDRFALVCMDAGNYRFRAASFDLAVGAAILHHVFDPARVIRACETALRPGGAAIFFEPFEAGHAVLQLAYRDIIAEADRRHENPAGIAVLRKLCTDYAARTGEGSAAALATLDDKWMFTREYFEALATPRHWRDFRIYPIHSVEAPLSEQTLSHLRLAMNLGEAALPSWSWDTLRRYEAAFSEAGRRNLVFEAAVVMRLQDWHAPRAEPGSGWWWNPAESGRGLFVEKRAEYACCAYFVYDEDGCPVWYVAGPGRVDIDGKMTATIERMQLPDPPTPASSDNEAAAISAKASPIGVSLSLHFEDERAILLDCAGSISRLEPQFTVAGESPSTSFNGWWIEDAEAPSWALVVDALGERVIVALLSTREWYVADATRRGRLSYEGQWLRFSGGQTFTGAYRPPAAPQEIGSACLTWTESGCLVAKLPGDHSIALKRLAFG